MDHWTNIPCGWWNGQLKIHVANISDCLHRFKALPSSRHLKHKNKFLKGFFQESKAPSTSYSLTDREKSILSLLVDRLSYKMIAERESISFHTVNSHIRKIYEKLHVHSLGEAVSKAIKENLI